MSDTSSKRENKDSRTQLSRRNFLTTSAGLAALTTTACAPAQQDCIDAAANTGTGSTAGMLAGNAPQAPFESFRDYIKAIEAHGLVLRVPRLDQDKFEMTALMYRLLDEYGRIEAPAILAEEVKIDGRWVKGPVIANHWGHWNTEAIAFGVEPVPDDAAATFRKVRAHLQSRLVKGQYVPIPPIEVSREQAPCKEVTLEGDAIDITRFAFIQNNPADVGRYVNTGAVFTQDPEMGMNFGTYRCQIKGPRQIGLNSEPGHMGWRMLMAARERGEEFARVSIALGQDPGVWNCSSSGIANRRTGGPIDELAVAGGLNGKAVKVVKSDTNDMLVPATAEMIIEGEVPLQVPGLPEAPYGEMYGHIGPRKHENLYMNITRITHRKDPWILNQFTGVHKGFFEAAFAAISTAGFQQMLPGFLEARSASNSFGLTYVSIDKTRPGQAIEIGKRLAAIVPIFKVIVVVDKDVDILDSAQVDRAIGARYAPATASYIIEEGPAVSLDPSLGVGSTAWYSDEADTPTMTSKIIIDATKQWPEEGGPEDYQRLSRDVLTEMVPESFELVEANWGDLIRRKDRNWNNAG